MPATIGGLSVEGRLVVLGADSTPMPLSTAGLIGKRAGIYGWPPGSSIDSEDTMRFVAMTGVRPMTETCRSNKRRSVRPHDEQHGAVVITTGN
jgi:D-arabinose 1-dehydrogenase-like Zn-dependent alcohol dehydrogenase